MIRSWIHTFATLADKAAGRNILLGLGLNDAVCTGSELQKYQPSQDGSDRLEITI